MANETTSGSVSISSFTGLSGLYSNIVQTALFTMNEKAMIRPLVTEYDITGQNGKTAQVPIYPISSTYQTGEGTDASNQQISATVVQIDTDEIAAMTTLTDTARDSAADNVAASIGKIFGETIARKIDEDLVALFAGFSNVVGDHSTAMNADLIFKAVATLRNNSVMGPYVGVVSPNAAFDLKKQLTSSGSANVPSLSDAGNQALREGFIGRLAGVDLYESALIGTTAVGDSTTGASCAVMTKDALALAIKKDLNIETERNASVRGTEIVASATYGVKELFDAHGVLVKSDNVATLS
jgi:N4-gp56 family major capsid protein